MPWNLLIFPLAAGYYLLTRSYWFRFVQQRLDRQRLIFESILLGAAIFGISYLFRLGFEFIFPEIITKTYEAFPYKVPYTLTSISTLFLAFIFSKIGNYFFDEEEYIKKAIKDVGNELELMLKSSFSEELLLQFTLDNDKFYIAWVKELPIPSISNYVRIIPAISGFRNEEKDLIFTCQYLSVYSEYIAEGKVTDIKELKTDLIIDFNNIISVSYFDPEMHSRFNRLKNNNKSSTKKNN